MKRIIYLFLLIIFVIIGELLIFYNNIIMILVICFLGVILIILIDQTTYAVNDIKENQKIKLICIFFIMTGYLSLTYIGLILLIKVIPDIVFLNSFGALLFGLIFSAGLFEGNFIMRDKKEYTYNNVSKAVIFMIIALILFVITLKLLIL